MVISIDEIIKRIKSGEALEAITLSFLPSAEQEILKRCAAVRTFDEPLVDAVLRAGVDGGDKKSLPFERLLAHDYAVERLPRTKDIYRIKEGMRQEYLKKWRTEQDALLSAANEVPPRLRELSDRLVTFYEELGPEGELDRLYHLIAVDTNHAASLFKDLYRKADEDFNRALCYDLLNILEERLPVLGPKLSELYNDYRLYYKARSLWVNEYYQSAQYYERRLLRNKFEALIRGNEHWILNLYARSGMGKTMFVRWLIARHCTTDQAKYYPCARIDFDDSEALKWAQEPLLLFLEISEQLNKQIKGAPLYELINDLQQFENILTSQAGAKQTPASNLSAFTAREQLIKKFSQRFVAALAESGLKTHVIIIFDTLEKIILHQRALLLPLLDQFAALRDKYPNLRLIFSARDSLEEKVTGFAEQYRNQTLSHELKKFSDEEARGYLKHKRDLKSRNPIGAILKKANGNPFKLALFADLVKCEPNLDAETVMSFHSSNMAELIFRIIDRTPDRRVQWLLRYGVVPRQLNLTILKEMMAPYLNAALTGKPAVDVQSIRLTQQLRNETGDRWVGNKLPEGADDLDGAWAALCQYASSHAWVSWVSGKTDTLKFHAEVVQPMRLELQKDSTFMLLQREAFNYFDKKAVEEPDKWDVWIREAIYHKFQLEGAAAGEYWHQQITSRMATNNPQWRLELAKEVIGPDYLDEDERPRKRYDKTELIDIKTLMRAYAEKAAALVELAGSSLNAPSTSLWNEADADCRWVEILQQTSPYPIIPRAQIAVVRGKILLNQRQYEKALEVIEKTLEHDPALKYRIELEVEYGDLESALGKHHEAVSHYKSALALLVQDSHHSDKFTMEVRSKLAQSYLHISDFTSAAGEYRAALELAEQQSDLPSVLNLMQRLIGVNLEMGQLDVALRYATSKEVSVEESDDLSVSIEQFRYQLAGGKVWLALREPLRALEMYSTTLQMEPLFEREVAEKRLSIKELKELRATVREFHGSVLNELMSYRHALEELELARSLWAEVGDSEGAYRCLLQIIDIWLRQIGNNVYADTLFEYAERYVSESIDNESVNETWLRLQLLRADWLDRADQRKEARKLVEQLIENSQNGWPPRMVVILTLETVAQQGFKPLEDYQILFSALKELEPASARINFPHLLRRCQELKGLPEKLIASVENLLAEPPMESWDFPSQALNLAETFRVLSNRRRSAEWLADAEVEFSRMKNWFPLLQILRTSRLVKSELPLSAEIPFMVSGFLSTYENYPTLCGAMLIEYVECLCVEEKYEEGRRQLEKAWDYLHQEKEAIPSRWLVRVEFLRSDLAGVAGDVQAKKVHAKRACSYLRQLTGNTEFYRKIIKEKLGKTGETDGEDVSGDAYTATADTKRIDSDSLKRFQHGFIMNLDSVRDSAVVFQIRREENELSLHLKLPHLGPWKRQLTHWGSQRLEEFLALDSAEPFSYAFLDRLLSDWERTGEEMGRLLMTPEDVAAIERLGSEQKLDLRLEVTDEGLASLPWELLQFPGRLGQLACLSEKLRFYYCSLTPDSLDVSEMKWAQNFLDVGEVKWVQKMLKKLMPAQTSNLVADGVYGDETKSVVLNFQDEQELLEDGKAGPVTIKVVKRLLRQEQLIGPPRVLILQASVEREQEVYRGGRRQGFDLANLYSRHGFEVEMLENPTVEHLRDSLRSQAPEIVHICATMKSSPSVGVYMDFASERTRKSESLSSSDNSVFTFSALSSQLKILSDSDQPRPILILDIARPPGITEILRQLLLRNAYAVGLIRLGGISSIVATGLGTFADQLKLSQLLIIKAAQGEPLGYIVNDIRGLAETTVSPLMDERQAGMDASQWLEQMIPFIGTALFTVNPFY